MRLSEFWALMEQEFGSGYAVVVARSHALGALDSRTAAEALEGGVPPRQVWRAVCADLDVPDEHHYLPDPKRKD
ncbi:DUF3046 domain-containing protein [Ornithinimicrobium avium]|uniref:DUF3046 domain-containing protein n=1 Tax=Ornithinimicrobium avium TaxID=2283195 RepID=A0A345NIE2_9MICO|nr:DUF3046 domain-containing protein [Ornithinimicrobium avium]AXH94800.1 DUF3046 domain-containing protein [Ornithinimicrobium avium]